MDLDLIERRILAAMESACQGEMVWGRDDCATWAADILKPVIGVDLIASFRGRYKTMRGAWRVMGKRKLRGHLESVAIERGWSWVPADRANAGDVGISNDDRSILICRAPGWFVGRGQFGFVALPSRDIAQAWAVK